MTTYTDLELDRILDEFLGEGPGAAPERAVEHALERVATVSQRRSPLVAGRFQMSVPVRLLLAAALALSLLAVGALYMGSRNADPVVVPGPSPTPSPTVPPSPTASAAATASSTPAPVTPPTSPVAALGLRAVGRVDAAIEAAKTAGEVVSDDQIRLFRLTDDIRLPLQEGGNVPAALTAYEKLPPIAAEIASTIGGPAGERLTAAVRTLGGVLASTSFVPGELAPATYFTTRLAPAVSMSVADGWANRLEDGRVLVLTKGPLTLGVHRTASEATAAALAEALGRADPADLTIPPVDAGLQSYPGFAGGVDDGGSGLWTTEAQETFDAAPGDVVRAWVIQAGGRPLTVSLVGPAADVSAALPEVGAMLDSLVVP